MGITIRKGEELTKIFQDGKYVGYLDENEDLYGFNEKGYAEKIDSCVSLGKVTRRFLEWATPKPTKRRKRCGKKEIELINALVLELEIELRGKSSPNIRRAVKYLNEIGQ